MDPNDIKVISVGDYLHDHLGSDDLMNRFNHNIEGGIINLKKFGALHWALKSGYHWMACIDSDTLAVRPLEGLFDVLRQNYAAARYIGNSVENVGLHEILTSCRAYFLPEDQVKIKNLTNDDSLYTWFFDVPFYEAADLADFFVYMADRYGSVNGFLCQLRVSSFEHILYVQWRSLYRGATLVNCSALGIYGDPEHWGFHTLMRVRDKFAYETSWARAGEFLINPDMLQAMPNLRMLFHFDRM